MSICSACAFAVALALAAVPAGYCQQSSDAKPRVSVVPFTPEGVSRQEATTLTRLFEQKLVKTGSFVVVEQSERDQILKAQVASVSDCTDESCAVEIGKLLAADSIIIGTASKVGTKFYVTVKLVDVAKGKSLRAETVDATSLEGLADAMGKLAEQVALDETSGGQGKLVTVEETAAASSGQQESARQSAIVTFESTPSGASFTVRNAAGEQVADGITPKALALSFATYTVEARDPEQVYYPFRDRLVVNTAGKFRYPIELKPNFGSMSVTSDPAGATVVRDGMRVGQTPYSLDRARAGEYRFVIQKDLYESRALTLMVEEGKIATASVSLEPAFVWLSVSEANGLAASLYLDGKLIGRLPWRSQVPFRDFDLRVAPDDGRYKEHTERIATRKRGETIERPLKLAGKFGSVLVNTDPYLEGTVFVDGKQVGTSPDYFELLVGEHEILVRGTQDRKVLTGKKIVQVREKQELSITVSMAPDAMQGTVDRWIRELDALEAILAGSGRGSRDDVAKAQALEAEVRRADFPLAELVARAAKVASGLGAAADAAEKEDRIAGVQKLLDQERARLAAEQRTRRGMTAGGLVSMVAGALLGGASGYLWYLSDQAYAAYVGAQYSDDAARYHEQVRLYDGLKVAGAATGGTALLLAPILWGSGPKPAATEQGVKELERLLETVRAGGEVSGTWAARARELVEGARQPAKAVQEAVVRAQGLLEMVEVRGGGFSMGSVAEPVHSVTVSSFLIGKYEVTQGQYQTVIGANPSYLNSGADAPTRPVERVSWYDAVAFCNALSAREGLTACYSINGTTVTADFTKKGYRLPTEAEWEYAARGGTGSAGYTYAGSGDVYAVAWYSSNSGSTTHPVGTRAANELGIYDMSGNVWEWCWDWSASYVSSAQTNPTGPTSGSYRVIRGGSWGYDAGGVRVALRSYYTPSGSYDDLGFRPVRTP